eukprot:scaffold28259_cov107-Isochrysis_galbana.AAC.4
MPPPLLSCASTPPSAPTTEPRRASTTSLSMLRPHPHCPKPRKPPARCRLNPWGGHPPLPLRHLATPSGTRAAESYKSAFRDRRRARPTPSMEPRRGASQTCAAAAA